MKGDDIARLEQIVTMVAQAVLSGNLSVNKAAIIERAVDEGVRYGVMRAFKHTDEPSREHLISTITQAVESSLYEYFNVT